MPKPICIKQHDMMDCGAACLASVAWHHGLKIPISTIREYAKTDRKGTNVLGLLQAAEKLGFAAKGVKASEQALSEVPLPAIAHVVLESGLHHYVVVYEVSPKHITIADPAKGIVKMERAKFLKLWSGVLVLLAPNLSFQKGDKRDSNMEKFFQLLRPYPALLIECFVSAAVYTLLGLATALYVEHLLDSVFPNANGKLLNVLSIAMILILLFKLFFGWTRQTLLMHVSQKIDAMLILGYYKHILKLPQSFFDMRRVGEIISRVNDAVKIRAAISSASLTIALDGLVLIFSFTLMFVYSWKLALVGAATLPLFLLLFWTMNKPIQKTQRSLMERAAELESQLVSSINAVSTIKTCKAEAFNNLKTEIKFVEILRDVWRSGSQGLINATASEFISGAALIALLWIGGNLVLNQELSVGELMSFYTLIGYVTAPASRLVGINQTVQDALIAADRLFEMMGLETEDEQHNGKLPLAGATLDRITFERVSFRYGTRAKVLDDVSFEIPIGKMTAIVGESGSGKSTVAKILQGFYPIAEGDVRFGSLSIKDIALTELRKFSAAVPQTIELFHGTIIQNIAYGDGEPDVQRILQLSAFIGADKFIKELPYSWNTILGEHGADLSGGQRQRLALARALYQTPKLLILDEATSALDSESEYAIQQALIALRDAGLTQLVITHRLHNVVNADQILVMDKGKVVERGTHSELLKMEGKYYALWLRQQPALYRATEKIDAV